MTQIPENLQLLGLLVTTLPFDYTDNVVKSSIELYVNIADLITTKEALEEELDHSVEDPIKQQLNSDIYFLNKVIKTLEGK